MSSLDIQVSPAHEAAAIIQKLRPDFVPKAGIVLGSGLGGIAGELEDVHHIPYRELPGFPQVSVHGHGGTLSAGYFRGVPVICLQGRSHGYEGKGPSAVRTYVRTLKLLGCEYFLATNASGSLREDAPPGSLMLITDHINLQSENPLTGPNDESFGPRFFPLDNAYDPALRQALLAIAEKEGVTLHQGVYLAVQGPNYETAAEIRAFRTLGADAVGMSTVPEVLVAAHCGLKTAVIATITNYATGLSKTAHCHNAVVQTAEVASRNLALLIGELMERLP